MPYENVASHNVYGANWYSEKWTQNENNTIIGVNLPFVKTGLPPDSLYIVLRNETDSQDVATMTVPQSDITTTLQWYERYFSSPISLVNGKSYRLILKSPGSTSSNYFTARSLVTSQEGTLTYDGTSSFYSYSSNGGASWTDMLTQDLTYILLLQNAGTMGWIVHPPWDGGVDTHASRCADFAWEYRAMPTFRNMGLLVYGTNAGQITWRRFRAPNFVGGVTNVAMGTSFHSWIQLKSNPRTIANDTIVLGAALEATTFDLGAFKWDGTTFTMIGSTAFTDDTATVDCECFEIEFAFFGDPMEFTNEVEFSGSSDLENWTSVTWAVDAAWSASNVSVTFQLFDYSLGAYSTGGDGYISYYSSLVPYVDETENQTIILNPTRFRDGSGQWKVKATGVKVVTTPFDMEVDLVKLQPPSGGPYFVFKNDGSLTSHIVSLWIISSSSHVHYDVSIYLSSGEDFVFQRDGIMIPSGSYTARIVTDRGNFASFSGS